MSGASKMAEARRAYNPHVGPGQIVLVFQGGGALGAYQAGVYQALHEAGIEPDWIIGTSIGAINASLIAGNEPHNRLPRLRDFWDRMAHKSVWHESSAWPQLSQTLSYWNTIARGIAGFFEPNPMAFWGSHVVLGADRAGYYSTAPLEKTLSELVDFSLVNRCRPRLTVGAAHVRTSQMKYFDSRDMPLGVKHVMASGALPPAFPAVRIDGELYWDGGILSNTPTEVIFDDNPRRNSLIFAVHMWNPIGPEPETMWEVMHRQKDIQYSSRVASHITRQLQTHRLRHVIKELLGAHPRDRAQQRGRARAGRLGLPDAHARRAPAGAAPRQRGPHQGRRFQPGRHPPALGGGLRQHAARHRAEALAGRVRSARGRHPARAARGQPR